MAQKAIYPMRFLRITQDELASYSHAGSLAHDNGGQSGNVDNAVYAPFDGTVARVRQNSSHETYFVSDGDVETPSGYVGVLTLTAMHDNVLDIVQGQQLAQGDKLGDEGGFGNGQKDYFAHHAHFEASKGKQTTQSKNSKGTYYTPNQMHLYDAFYLHPDTMVYTKMANGVLQWVRAGDNATAIDHMGHVWKVAQAESDVMGNIDANKPMRLVVTGENCEYFAARDVYQPLGKLAKDTVYNVTEYYPDAVPLPVAELEGRWVRFAFENGEEAYCLVLPDRAALENTEEAAKTDKSFGLDISKHQGTVDFDALDKTGKAKFIIVRTGYGSSEPISLQTDAQFTRNMTEAAKRGYHLGAYHFSYAASEADAVSEAKMALALLEPFREHIDLPIFFDLEYEGANWVKKNRGIDIDAALAQRMTEAFCETVKKAGYMPGVYVNKDLYTRWYSDEWFARTGYAFWYARPGLSEPDKPCDIWQYAVEHGGDYGFNGNVDKNICYMQTEPVKIIDRVSVRVNVGRGSSLNIREAPSTAAVKVGSIPDGMIVALRAKTFDAEWGYIDGRGWISLAYTGEVMM